MHRMSHQKTKRGIGYSDIDMKINELYSKKILNKDNDFHTNFLKETYPLLFENVDDLNDGIYELLCINFKKSKKVKKKENKFVKVYSTRARRN